VLVHAASAVGVGRIRASGHSDPGSAAGATGVMLLARDMETT
jgi:3-deoxy-D-manno-octulosonic acid (KDO) 8-phosphate synthase